MADFSTICTRLLWKWFAVSVFSLRRLLNTDLCDSRTWNYLYQLFGHADVLLINGQMEEVI